MTNRLHSNYKLKNPLEQSLLGEDSPKGSKDHCAESIFHKTLSEGGSVCEGSSKPHRLVLSRRTGGRIEHLHGFCEQEHDHPRRLRRAAGGVGKIRHEQSY